MLPERPLTHPDTMGENNTPTQPLRAVGSKSNIKLIQGKQSQTRYCVSTQCIPGWGMVEA